MYDALRADRVEIALSINLGIFGVYLHVYLCDTGNQVFDFVEFRLRSICAHPNGISYVYGSRY